ncbi:hypothetical protein N183_14830 [Sinorhizobium sp. Sb3]|uniref:hypothetical protein n=1 Tax=Sinorhizobium sp. Sb3 TaxID=1358417 RepID=UPI00071C52F3|nr:hypothetical protein [Sinorhizobium sp. Sb3]KSV81785.1 hypothetical protein N183_14830 [Sinorhizobium sp. Sb3]
MSGPKVVRIVTREEIIAICEGHLAQLEAAAAQWKRVCERNSVIDDNDVAQVHARVEAMQALLASEKFEELQKRVPAEIAFLNADVEKRVQRAADEAVSARKRAQRSLAAARSVAAALRDRGLDVPPALSDPGAAPAEELQAAFVAAFAALSPRDEQQLSRQQIDLAAALGAGEERRTFASWLEGQTPALQDPLDERLEHAISELAALQPAAAEPFRERASELEGTQSSQKALLVDSLMLDIAEARRLAFERHSVIGKIEAVAAQLRQLGGDTNLVALEDSYLETADLRHLHSVLATVESGLARLQKKRAAEAGRQALLEGLSKLGYDVRQGMETAWVRNGSIVLESPSHQGYGVEVGGDPSGMVQLRTVRFGGSDLPNAEADKTAETEFCSSFDKLRDGIAGAGGDIAIVRALGVGTTPVKRVSAPTAEVATDAPQRANVSTKSV